KQPDGSVEKWSVEAGSPNVLFRRGFTKQALLPGIEIVVDGYRAKDGTHRANGRDLTLPDGRTLFLGGSSPDAPDQRSEEHTSELQSPDQLVCRLLLEKKQQKDQS